MIQMMALGGVTPQNTVGSNSTTTSTIPDTSQFAKKASKKTQKKKNYQDPDKIVERQEKRREYYLAERA